MKKLMVLMCVLTVVAMCAGDVLAGVKQGSVTISPSAGGYRFDSDKELGDNGRMYNLGIGYNFTKNIGIEANFSLIDADADSCNCKDNQTLVYFPRAEILYHIMPDKMFVPYLAVGGGYQFYRYDDDKNLRKEKLDDAAIVDYGLGLKVFLTDNLALRGDVRHFYDITNSANDFAVTAGFVYAFGGEEKKPVKVEEKKPEVKKPETKPETKMAKEPSTPQPVKGADKTLPPVKKEEPKKEEKIEVTVLFEFNKTVVKPMYKDQLQKVADFMKANPTAVATVEGHTDNVGSEKYNLNLSRKRAQSVKNYIVKNFRVDPSRITISWFGKNKPAADNKTEEGRKLNRRAITISIKK
jgi:OOP family OmpA-OmpF porin